MMFFMKYEKFLIIQIKNSIFLKNIIKKLYLELDNFKRSKKKKIKNNIRFFFYFIQEKFKNFLFYELKKKFYFLFFIFFFEKDFMNQDFFSIARYLSSLHCLSTKIFRNNVKILGWEENNNLEKERIYFFFIKYQILIIQLQIYLKHLFRKETEIFNDRKYKIMIKMYQNIKIEIKNNLNYIIKFEVQKLSKKTNFPFLLEKSYKEFFIGEKKKNDFK